MRADLSPESVKDLSDSIRKVGLIQPIVVTPKNDRYEVIAGHRRVVACSVAGLVKVDCYVIDASGTVADVLKLHENYYREDVNPVDEALFLRYMKDERGMSSDEIANLINKSRRYVDEHIAIIDYPEDVLIALQQGDITHKVGIEFSRIGDDVVRKEFVRLATDGGVRAEVARRWRQGWEDTKGESGPSEIVDDIKENPPERQEYLVECAICREKFPLRMAKMIYVHQSCYDDVNRPEPEPE